MGVLLLKCPTTGQEFSTGVELEQDTFKKLPDTVTKARCPYCGLMHNWWTREARWVDGFRPNEWAAAFDRAS
jgi:hypothetical protein